MKQKDAIKVWKRHKEENRINARKEEEVKVKEKVPKVDKRKIIKEKLEQWKVS